VSSSSSTGSARSPCRSSWMSDRHRSRSLRW
jgi:hypothetical protein